MADMSELGVSAEPKGGGETLKARFVALVEANSAEIVAPEREDEVTRFGEFGIESAGPILFDGVRFVRRQFINYQLPGDPFYFADTIALTFASTSIYGITYDAMSGEFGSVETADGGAELLNIPDDSQAAREKAAQALVNWLESVELDLQFRGGPDFAI